MIKLSENVVLFALCDMYHQRRGPSGHLGIVGHNLYENCWPAGGGDHDGTLWCLGLCISMYYYGILSHVTTKFENHAVTFMEPELTGNKHASFSMCF